MIKLVGVVGFGKIRTLGGTRPQTPARGTAASPRPPPEGYWVGVVRLFEFLLDESGDLGELLFQAVDVCLHLIELGVEGGDG